MSNESNNTSSIISKVWSFCNTLHQPASKDPWTREVWIYDDWTNIRHTLCYPLEDSLKKIHR